MGFGIFVELVFEPNSMRSNTLIEVFGHIVFRFTQGLTEHYNPQEPEYTAQSFGYSSLQSTGKSMYIGTLISLLAAIIIGSVGILMSYLCYKNTNNCEFLPTEVHSRGPFIGNTVTEKPHATLDFIRSSRNNGRLIIDASLTRREQRNTGI